MICPGVNGTLDTTFNSTGKKTVDIGSGTTDAAYAVALQSDGKIVVAGTSNGDFAVIRLNANGTLDTTFNSTGKQTVDIGSGTADIAYTVAFSPSSGIYLAGVGGSYADAIVRLTSSGALDTTFNTTGKLTFRTHTSDYGEIRAAAVSPAGELYVTVADTNTGEYFLARVTAAGQLDTTFNANGYTTQYACHTSACCGTGDWATQAYAITLQSDGKVVVAGTTMQPDHTISFMFAMRFLHQVSGGQILDTSFNGGCAALVSFDTSAAAYAVSVRSTGEIYLAGEADQGSASLSPLTPYSLPTACGTSSFAAARLTSAGAIDTRFDYDGKLTTVFSSGGNSKINAAAITPDGKYTAAGTVDNVYYCCGSGSWVYDYDFALARYNAPSGLEERRFVEQDANHNVTSISDALGNVVERYEYTPYGQRTVLTASWGATTPVANTSAYAWVYGHQGGRLDPTTLDWYFRNRDLWSAAERWTQFDPNPAGPYVDGMNAFGVERTSPLGGVDSMGLFMRPDHRLLAETGADGFGMRPNYKTSFVESDVHTDDNQFSDAIHAQSPSWLSTVQEQMHSIAQPVPAEEKAIGHQIRVRAELVTRAMGRAAHVLQDYFSHTDWIEGSNMLHVYLEYNDEGMLKQMGASKVYSYHTLNGHPMSTFHWELMTWAHQPHYSEIINMDDLWSGKTDRYSNVIYYMGGGVTTLGPVVPSQHERYSADVAGQGRDQRGPKGIAGAYSRAYNRANFQTVAFVRWARDHMDPCVRRVIFGS